jgi:hypothetical protein
MTVGVADMNVRGHHAERAEGGMPIETERGTNLHAEIEVAAVRHTMELPQIEMSYLMEFL